MKHIDHISSSPQELPESFIVRATGRYYTHDFVASHMINAVLSALSDACEDQAPISIIDPFAGDGRLVVRLLDQWYKSGLPARSWEVNLWDLNSEGLEVARLLLDNLIKKRSLEVQMNIAVGDSFLLSSKSKRKFDIVITNPPWELLKPERRELKQLNQVTRDTYIRTMREYDQFLADAFPSSQPSRKFAGWGTNLSRVGLDASRQLVKKNGLLAIVMPASFFADNLSAELRRSIMKENTLYDIAYFPAEAKLFGKADQATITAVIGAGVDRVDSPVLTRYDSSLNIVSSDAFALSESYLESTGFTIPVSVGSEAIRVLDQLAIDLPIWADLEGPGGKQLWAGREIDETGSENWLSPDGDGPFFIKGRMVGRFHIVEQPVNRIMGIKYDTPSSSNFERIAWRDVSRPNQKRRVIASIIPQGWIAGNSLGIAYFRDGNPVLLRTLLGVLSSLVFEFQLKCYLATGHISLSSLRKVRIPHLGRLESLVEVSEEVDALLKSGKRRTERLEALVARKVYGLNEEEFRIVLAAFPKITPSEESSLIAAFARIHSEGDRSSSLVHHENSVTVRQYAEEKADDSSHRIHNHSTARLSELDMLMVRSVPPGGNWKNIPENIPSRRLARIRESYARGEGSRSTYYGRLAPDKPAYTINTYFNRPGNGCHIHYSQHRVLSQREAARLQSFPDCFEFCGSQGSVNKQIGNAVPPLLAYQIALKLGEPGHFIDLFCGAGGLGLGFVLAGWKPVVANDIDSAFLKTYATNIHDSIIHGSLTDPSVRREIVERVRCLYSNDSAAPLWVLGGPPCQGFSTAGNRRSMSDERNHLFRDYTKILEELRPDGFLFENVPGLLSIQGGMIFELVKQAFREVMPNLVGWRISAEEYAIPQKRKRVFLIGSCEDGSTIRPPSPITGNDSTEDLFISRGPLVSVEDAIGDLPPLAPGQDGSDLEYIGPPRTSYQAFMRNMLSVEEYIRMIEESAT